ncbi:gag-pol fusion protein [Lasius niger]|uniref:RNA-directed DNA polymerase n=1 Tax=Lasius niger TaxID=67767 RepID=A0A0J7KQ09_LASNI|nr:gag-pol fusion protein [Lasius niger]
MPFGLHSAPATFQRLLDKVLGSELEPHVQVYLDDIVIASRTFEDYLAHLSDVFSRLRHARLRLNPKKCHFCRPSLKYLGHIVDRNGIRTDPDKYRRFIANFSAIAAPLTRLAKKGIRWTWTDSEEQAFQQLKQALTTTPVLACPDFARPFTLQTDASTHGLGAVLTQQLDEGERVIAYASRTLNAAERNYSATELECFAVVWGIRRMRDYVKGYRFTVLTDHQALRWLQRLEAPTKRLARWVFELQQYDFDI